MEGIFVVGNCCRMNNVCACTAFRMAAGCCSRFFSCGWQLSVDEDVSDTSHNVSHKQFSFSR